MKKYKIQIRSQKNSKSCVPLKGHGNEADFFLGFLQKLVPHESLTLPFDPFRFWPRIRGDIHIRKTTPHYHRYTESATPRITGTESRLLNFWKENSLYRWYGDSSTPRTGDMVSCRLPISLSRRVADSTYHWYGESPTPRITDMESRRLHVSLSRGVDDSADQWYGSRYSKKKLIWCRFSELLTAKPCL